MLHLPYMGSIADCCRLSDEVMGGRAMRERLQQSIDGRQELHTQQVHLTFISVAPHGEVNLLTRCLT